jgi:hypothetical protein
MAEDAEFIRLLSQGNRIRKVIMPRKGALWRRGTLRQMEPGTGCPEGPDGSVLPFFFGKIINN